MSLGKTDVPHQHQPQNPRWLLRLLTAVEYYLIKSILHGTVQLLLVDVLLQCFYAHSTLKLNSY